MRSHTERHHNVNPDHLLPHQIYDPLFGDIMKQIGPSIFTRVLARMHEAAKG